MVIKVDAPDELTDEDLEWLNYWALDVVRFERWPWPIIPIEPDPRLTLRISR